jgi:hypothetical protein
MGDCLVQSLDKNYSLQKIPLFSTQFGIAPFLKKCNKKNTPQKKKMLIFQKKLAIV